MDTISRPQVQGEVKGSCLYVINLPPTVDDQTLCDVFSQFGEVQSCRSVPNTGEESSNVGFVNMVSSIQAQHAVSRLNGIETESGVLTVTAGPPVASRQSPCDNVYIRNMPASWTEQDLRDIFAPYGSVQECRVLHRGDDVRGAGALVRMNTLAAASQAILGLNGQVPMSHLKDFTSLPLLVRYADSPEEKARKQARKEQLATGQHRSLDLPAHQQPVFPFRLTGKSLDLSPQQGVAQEPGLTETLNSSFAPFETPGILDIGANLPTSLFADTQAQSSLESILNASQPSVSTITDQLSLSNNALALNALSNYARPSVLAQSQAASNTAAGQCTSLYIKNLPPEADRLWLYERFAPHGSILSVKVLQEERSSRCRGVGFVNFAEAHGALKAISNVNGVKVADKHLHVSLQVNRGRF